MFGLFETKDLQHPEFGVFSWERGCWRGRCALACGVPVPLIIAGSRKGPDHAAFAHAARLGEDLQQVESQLKQALFDHYQPYAEAFKRGRLTLEDGPFPALADANEALALAEIEAVVIMELDGELATEICYSVPWDEEHILGARFRGPSWIELCGSTAMP
ncbi:MAG: DUF6985 domain-containing protein [Roseateles sp.]